MPPRSPLPSPIPSSPPAPALAPPPPSRANVTTLDSSSALEEQTNNDVEAMAVLAGRTPPLPSPSPFTLALAAFATLALTAHHSPLTFHLLSGLLGLLVLAVMAMAVLARCYWRSDRRSAPPWTVKQPASGRIGIALGPRIRSSWRPHAAKARLGASAQRSASTQMRVHEYTGSSGTPATSINQRLDAAAAAGRSPDILRMSEPSPKIPIQPMSPSKYCGRALGGPGSDKTRFRV